MTTHTPSASSPLPAAIPVFPLTGVLLLPRGNLPLNIFEPRYMAMLNDALRGDRLIGMIQPRPGTDNGLFQTGCAGRVTSFTETDDGRYEISLRGVSRFHVAAELPLAAGGYRSATISWAPFARDLEPAQELNIDRRKLRLLLQSYFDMEGMDCSWSAIDNASDDTLITCLSMVCPLDAGEKQALLEAACCKTRADMFMAMLDMATRDSTRQRPEKSCCH